MYMAAVIHNFVLEQGTSLNKKFRRKTNDQSVDLTGFTAHSQFRESLVSNDVLIDLSTDNSGIVINPTDGLVMLVFKPEHTKGALWKKAMYDLELISPEGLVTRLVVFVRELADAVTWGANITHVPATPVTSTMANKRDFFTLRTFDNGVKCYCFAEGGGVA